MSVQRGTFRRVQILLQPLRVGREGGSLGLHPLIRAKVVRDAPDEGSGRDLLRGSKPLDPMKELVDPVHARHRADKHRSCQVPIGLLNSARIGTMQRGMAKTFREALLWHMQRAGIGPAKLAQETGVSLDVIKKLRTHAIETTAVENAILIAAYFGLSLEAFMRAGEDQRGQALSELAALLTPEEARLLEAQLRGLLASRGRR